MIYVIKSLGQVNSAKISFILSCCLY